MLNYLHNLRGAVQSIINPQDTLQTDPKIFSDGCTVVTPGRDLLKDVSSDNIEHEYHFQQGDTSVPPKVRKGIREVMEGRNDERTRIYLKEGSREGTPTQQKEKTSKEPAIPPYPKATIPSVPIYPEVTIEDAEWIAGELVTNAVKHTPPGGDCATEFNVSDKGVVITVENQGKEINYGLILLKQQVREPFVTELLSIMNGLDPLSGVDKKTLGNTKMLINSLRKGNISERSLKESGIKLGKDSPHIITENYRKILNEVEDLLEVEYILEGIEEGKLTSIEDIKREIEEIKPTKIEDIKDKPEEEPTTIEEIKLMMEEEKRLKARIEELNTGGETTPAEEQKTALKDAVEAYKKLESVTTIEGIKNKLEEKNPMRVLGLSLKGFEIFEECGRGLYTMHEFADELTYERTEDGRNRVTAVIKTVSEKRVTRIKERLAEDEKARKEKEAKERAKKGGKESEESIAHMQGSGEVKKYVVHPPAEDESATTNNTQ